MSAAEARPTTNRLERTSATSTNLRVNDGISICYVLLSEAPRILGSATSSGLSLQRWPISRSARSSSDMQVSTVIRQFMQMDSNVLPGPFTRLNSDCSLIPLRLPKTTPSNLDEVHQDELIPAGAALFRHSLQR